ncbi:Gfo/Idh/MocA family protein [Rhodococcus marinonascens]|uniref:Gfo/Idh/MocA family protein n=1 Tax=Rhodococcus marinonascens TaxID=38311 RepID=UPI000932B5B1|nr:Gfo/Idh/MocA family oxidoreductase [Rhodococcus marinonascens]
MSTPLRIGILGASSIGEDAIVKPAKATGHRLVAIAARNPDRARAYAARHGIERTVATYADLISDPEVDVVYNALPNGLHGPWNIEAVRTGKNVLTEKPFSSNAEEAEAVVAEAAAAGVTVLEGIHYVFHPVNQRLFGLVRSGDIGTVTAVETEFRTPLPAASDPRWELPLAGGSMMDVGCYGIHAARMLADVCGGTPRVVGTRVQEYAPGVDSRFDADLEYPSGIRATVASTMLADHLHFTFRVIGTEGEVLVHNFLRPHDDDRVSVTIGGTTTVEHLGTKSSYTFQLEALADHLSGGTTLPIGPADAVANMRMIDEAYLHAGLGIRPTSFL